MNTRPMNWRFVARLVATICLWSSVRLPAAEPIDRYAGVVSSEKGLAAYWRMEGDLKDSKTACVGTFHGGEPRFADGPAGGKALVLSKGQRVTVDKAAYLDLPETTIELIFKLTAKPSDNACLIAKRGPVSNKETRYSIHVGADLSALLIWNGTAVLRADFPMEPLKVGRWYHLVVAAKKDRTDVYLDGVCCAHIGGAGFSFDAAGLPLQIGAANAGGMEQCVCQIDEIAVYGRMLSERDVAGHVEAIGWSDKRAALLRRTEEIRKQRRAQWRERRRGQMAMLEKRINDPALVARGRQRVYRGEHLTAIAMPLGGIGAGCIQINGAAERANWQIFGNFSAATVPNSFFAVRAKAGNAEPVVRALQTGAVGPFKPVKALSFRGAYPFGWYAFEDDGLPVAISMEAFCPMIPLDAKDSAIPCAIFNLTAENKSSERVEVAFLAAQQNAVGFTGDAKIDGRRHKDYGGNRNRVLRKRGVTVLHMTADKPKTAPGYGDMALAALTDNVSATGSWATLGSLLDDVARRGALSGGVDVGPSPAAETLDGALAVTFTLEGGQSRTVPFVLTWYFPNVRHGAGRWSGKGNMSANWWDDAVDVAEYVHTRLDELTRLTRLYVDTLYATNLPHWLLDRISSQVAILRSKTCFWSADDFFGGWEGCSPASGCCHGNCAHVWHYAQAHARLFPSIARRMRQQALRHQQADGGIPFRLPQHGQACDAQCGEVLEAYREHLTSADATWLGIHWPRIKKAMDHVIARWDADEDGVLGGIQHNTLDCELGGSSSWLGTLYLAALRAAERMAVIEKYDAAAERYRRIHKSGATKQNETLWNGEYYVQIPDTTPQRDYNNGCHIDQVLGQWWAHQLDLGWLYPPDRVRGALRSLLKYNFQNRFHGLVQRPRKFVHDDDAGMQMIVWPDDDRPANHMLYADEVMTGFEYSAAAAMVQAGLLREGFAVVKAVADRYDGRLRTGLTPGNTSSWGYSGNPFGDDECGKFYARAMSVWSMLLACQGFVYDGPAGVIGFEPVWQPEDHVSFFSAAEGWGLFTQKRTGSQQRSVLEIRYGRLRVRSLVLAVPKGAKANAVSVMIDGRVVAARSEVLDGRLTVRLESDAVVPAGHALNVEIK